MGCPLEAPPKSSWKYGVVIFACGGSELREPLAVVPPIVLVADFFVVIVRTVEVAEGTHSSSD
jgi:hypothetical protein